MARKFGVSVRRYDGLSGWCLDCRAAREKRWRAKNPELVKADNRRRYAENPERYAAKVTVARAVKAGILIKPKSCTRKGCPDPSRRVEAHHYAGYAPENRLKVHWHCRSCHRLEEIAMRELEAA